MLNRNSYFVREHVGVLKLSDTFDILDPETQAPIGIAKEKPGGLMHVLRFLFNKRMLPTKVHVYEGSDPNDEGKRVFTIDRGFTLFRSQVNVRDARGELVGWFKSKLLSLGGAFRVFSANGQEVALVQGDWKGWNFRFLDAAQNVLGTVTKKWAGIGKELFTSADNYMISLHGEPNEML
ncbi:MAG TPA: phospholipid scramblase-related protein, partial [Phycisphaerae bacterium]|nr:phospholipid scramblase-related protein [Phycisphaerae bacterium]